MFNAGSLSALLTGLLVIVVIPDVLSYSKYGRNCKDIGCRSDEVCVMAEDPCTDYSNKCGRYPTCKKMNDRGFESAGVDIVNGQHVSSSDTNKHTNTNTNPFANANAPPAPADPIPGGNGYHQVNSGTNLGYPSYPSNVGTSNSNHGYPPYPSTNRENQPRTDNLGYPPYPTMNRMPQPGQGYPGQGYPPYPGQSGYPQTGYPQQQYPNGQRYPVGQYSGYQNYPNQNHRGYAYNSNSPYHKNVPYPIPSPTPPPRAYGPGRSSGRSGSRNTIGDNSIWNRLFGDDRNRGSNGRSSGRSNSHRTRDDYYNTHASTDNRGNRVWTFSG
ncbi:annexin B11-like isoform X2 [Vespa mandarinia]|uniref:annexin B11-like isoform X2 n=1 Tax=Vespa mandarinia TaxID=7446 RepID=UPI00161353E8|nr:annexin B11-like isoform X2 [Vespa mandarinia]